MARSRLFYSEDVQAKIRDIARMEGREDVLCYVYSPEGTAADTRYVFQSWVSVFPGVKEVCQGTRDVVDNVYALWLACKSRDDNG